MLKGKRHTLTCHVERQVLRFDAKFQYVDEIMSNDKMPIFIDSTFCRLSNCRNVNSDV
jgi:hypothetical protein